MIWDAFLLGGVSKHIYIYIYIYKERIREGSSLVFIRMNKIPYINFFNKALRVRAEVLPLTVFVASGLAFAGYTGYHQLRYAPDVVYV
jgi:hypothetical protein